MIITNPFAIVAPTADEGDAATRRAPTALSFGPHDPLYGTGVGADIRTWIAQGVHPLAAITRVEARNTQKLQGVLQMPTEAVQRQWEAVRGDTLIDAVKTGLLGDARMTQAVGDLMRAARSEASVGRWVCDPEWIARSGEQRVEQAVMAVSRTHLLPYADVIAVDHNDI
ncbi:MAG: bifunctional hydroxymethylpyrimidine kinase/phosphomethylpyrimidine kinase, partial [Myxococcota bacterium]